MGHIVAQETDMPSNDVVPARIDPVIKEEAAIVLATMGLSISDAFECY